MVRSRHPRIKPRLTAAGPRRHGALASMLRLSRAGERLPSRTALSAWLERAALPLAAEDHPSRQ